jgi:RHS repeat-associated protein
MRSSNTGGASDTYTYDQLERLSTVTDASGATTYSYDAVGNLQNFSYPNGVTHAYSYDTLNRLTQVGAAKNANSISHYAYTLGVAGNRLTAAELSGRSVAYGYDSLYRLTTEAVTSDPHNNNGTASYTYDSVGNRKTLTSTLPPAGGMTYTYDADDRLGSDTYDNDGNTINSVGIADSYDFENHMIAHGGVTLVYDGDGNRVAETIGGVTTNYLVDTVNPTGYAQVVDELQSGAVARTYSYGLERISEGQTLNSEWTPSFYGYDGHGSVRQLTNSAGAITDTYDYDAFGNLTNSTGSTANNYLFAGEQYDPALGLYYDRARYLNTTTGRFWSMDPENGDPMSPMSLHRYLYAGSDPVNGKDPTGLQADMAELGIAESVGNTVFGMSTLQSQIVIGAVLGGLLNAALATAVTALKGGTPEQVQDATASGALWGTLLGAAGSVAAAFTLGKVVLTLAGFGFGGYQSYSEYRQGNYGLATLYAALSLGSAVLGYLSLRTPAPAAPQSDSSLGTMFRYISDDELDAAVDDYLPNTNRFGEPRDIALTTEQYTESEAAEDGLLMGAQNPTGATPPPVYGVEVSTDGIKISYAGNSATNGPLEVRTPNSVRILRIWRLR